MRANRSKTGKRRSHAALSATRLSTCSCGALRVSHRACPQCGKYGDTVVIDVVARAKREARRTKRKQTELRESGQTTETKETAKT
jgi:large subunit ribosomal protein L32